jgi:hypothetical protein
MTEVLKQKPRVSDPVAKAELDKVEKQLDNTQNEIRSMSFDKLNLAPTRDREEPRLSQKEIDAQSGMYLKPNRSVGCKEKFNEDYRKEYEFSKEYVNFVAQNNEIIGESIDMWTKPFAGIPAEYWRIPVGKPIWAPRYVAEQIKRCRYHKLVMRDHIITEQNSMGQMYGAMAVEETVRRLDAHPVNQNKSIFMNSGAF